MFKLKYRHLCVIYFVQVRVAIIHYPHCPLDMSADWVVLVVILDAVGSTLHLWRSRTQSGTRSSQPLAPGSLIQYSCLNSSGSVLLFPSCSPLHLIPRSLGPAQRTSQKPNPSASLSSTWPAHTSYRTAARTRLSSTILGEGIQTSYAFFPDLMKTFSALPGLGDKTVMWRGKKIHRASESQRKISDIQTWLWKRSVY